VPNKLENHVTTAAIKTKKLNDLQKASLDALLSKDLGFTEFLRLGAQGATIAWLAKNGLTREVAVPVEGRLPLRAWTITDAGREAQASGRFIPVAKAPDTSVDAGIPEHAKSQAPRNSRSGPSI
jgi:hypothetical protein